jgi:hypothetical protein
MSRENPIDYLNERLRAAEEEVARFKTAIADHGMHCYERDINGERDITARMLKEDESVCEEYRRLIQLWSSK